MTKYAAMIRGIGPENPNMKGAKLVEAFESCGFANVRSFLTSGNILFESEITDRSKLERLAEAALPRILGFERAVFIRSQADLQKLISANPFGDLKHQNAGKTYLTVTFFKPSPPHLHKDGPCALEVEYPYSPEGKHFQFIASVEGALCSVVDLSKGKTPDLMAYLERTHGRHLTTRTWNTIIRLHEKLK